MQQFKRTHGVASLILQSSPEVIANTWTPLISKLRCHGFGHSSWSLSDTNSSKRSWASGVAAGPDNVPACISARCIRTIFLNAIGIESSLTRTSTSFPTVFVNWMYNFGLYTEHQATASWKSSTPFFKTLNTLILGKCSVLNHSHVMHGLASFTNQIGWGFMCLTISNQPMKDWTFSHSVSSMSLGTQVLKPENSSCHWRLSPIVAPSDPYASTSVIGTSTVILGSIRNRYMMCSQAQWIGWLEKLNLLECLRCNWHTSNTSLDRATGCIISSTLQIFSALYVFDSAYLKSLKPEFIRIRLRNCT